jgi:DNA (cytosine-5)-methyltransferase 1
VIRPAYYNEIDPFAAQWLRNLIAAGHIAPGDVDERSIEDVQPDDLRRYAQCHFFAGIGVWSAALRGIGWPDDERVWTGSCPCQPFSPAGKGGGFADERHLWPAFFHLITQCQPEHVVGEQVADRGGLAWLDLVHTDMEAAEYAFAAVDFGSAGVGAPHRRQRLYWVAHATNADGRGAERGAQERVGMGELWRGRLAIGGHTHELEHSPSNGRQQGWTEPSGRSITGGCGPSRMGDDDDDARPQGHGQGFAAARGWNGTFRPTSETSELGGVGDPKSFEGADQFGSNGNDFPRGSVFLQQFNSRANGGNGSGTNTKRSYPMHGTCEKSFETERPISRPGPVNGFWRNADWLFCRDGKWRPVEPGTFPLAHGATSRVGRLRAYGNAVNLAQAEIFLAAALELGDATLCP